MIPITRLTKNWRTECQGIRDMCADMLTSDAEEMEALLGYHEEAGGVEFEPCGWSERGAVAAKIFAGLIDEGADINQIAILSPHKDGDAGCEAANIKTRMALGFDPRSIEKHDLLIITQNNYHAPCTPRAAPRQKVADDEDEPEEETIYNGERCAVVKCGSDYLDLEFPTTSSGLTRRVRLLMENPNGDARAQLPEGVAFGYAMSTHKAQGSQFDFVIEMAERGYGSAGVVQGSNVYTAVSRARIKVFIVGNPEDFAQGATTPEISRETLLKTLLVNGASA